MTQAHHLRLFCLFVLPLSLLACGQKAPVLSQSPALESAQRLERKAMAAYTHGDTVGARKDLTLADQVYASLALQNHRVQVQLSLARLDVDEGLLQNAQEKIQNALQTPNLDKNLQSLAYGRSAAVALQQQDLKRAQQQLDLASQTCTSPCASGSALAALQAQLALAQNQFELALQAAAQASVLATNPSDKANAFRLQAQSAMAAGQAERALAHAMQALALDQELGQSRRVIADLQLISSAYRMLGQSTQAAQYDQLALNAQKARDRLQTP